MIPRTTRVWRLGELAAALGVECRGGADVVIEGVASLGEAGQTDLAAVYGRRALAAARESAAGALIAAPEHASALENRVLLLAGAPKAVLARAIELVRPVVAPQPGVHPSASLGNDVQLGDGVTVGPHAIVGDGCRIGQGTVIGAGAALLERVVLGALVTVHPNVVVYPETVVGDECVLLAGAVVGAPGFGHAVDADGRVVRVPHLGRVVLERGVEIGANTTVDRATFGETRIGERTRIDNLVQVGHNALVASDVMIAAQSGLSGSSRVGRGVVMGGQSGVADHVTVSDRAAVAAKTAVFKDVAEGEAVAGTPAMPIRLWRRVVAVQARLPEIWASVRRKARDEGVDE